LGLSALFADPAAAQLAGSVAIDCDYRLRGYSLTDDRPAASAQLTYDDPSGLYANLTALTALGHGDVRLLGGLGNVGYAKRLSSHLTLDAGVLRSQIRAAAHGKHSYDYTEVYAGAFVGPVSGRIYYSPDYRAHGVRTLYGELESGFAPAADWRISGHVGMLVYLNSSPYYNSGSTHRDWRISVSRQLGRFEIHSALSGGDPSHIYGYRVHKTTALTVGASFSL
jgi:uncharacterized protein (TIGR02001 family)